MWVEALLSHAGTCASICLLTPNSSGLESISWWWSQISIIPIISISQFSLLQFLISPHFDHWKRPIPQPVTSPRAFDHPTHRNRLITLSSYSVILRSTKKSLDFTPEQIFLTHIVVTPRFFPVHEKIALKLNTHGHLVIALPGLVVVSHPGPGAC